MAGWQYYLVEFHVLSLILFGMHHIYSGFKIISTPSIPSPAPLDPIVFFLTVVHYIQGSIRVCHARMWFISGSCVFLVHALPRVCLIVFLLWCVCACAWVLQCFLSYCLRAWGLSHTRPLFNTLLIDLSYGKCQWVWMKRSCSPQAPSGSFLKLPSLLFKLNDPS